MVTIKLSNAELYVAGHVGTMRRVASIQKKIPDTKNSKRGFWETDADGAAAEMAVAKYFGVYWVPSVNAGKASDVLNFQVRSTSWQNGKLIIRTKDKKNEKYILVTVNVDICNIVGWTWADDAKKEKFWKPEDHTGESAWWVPQSELQPMETING